MDRLGMNVKPNNFSEFDNPQRSLIKTMKEENYIPSSSYGYTTGAYYSRSAHQELIMIGAVSADHHSKRPQALVA